MKKLFSVLCIAFLLTAFGCAKKQETVKTLSIGILPIEDNLPFFVAEKDGLYAKNGIKVTLIPFDSARERDIAMLAGKIDGEVADMVAVGLLKKGGSIVKIASIGLGTTSKEGRFVLLASPAMAAKTTADLKGKTIAISENTIIEFMTDQIFGLSGISPSDIKKISIPPIPTRLEALTHNKVDAAVLPDPLASLAEKQGAKIIFDDTTSDVNLSQTVILFSEKAVTENNDAVKKLLKVYEAAGLSLTNTPDNYRTLAFEKARIPKPIQQTYKLPVFSTLSLPTQEEYNRIMDWMVSKKLLEKPYTYNELVDESLIK